MNNNFLCTGGTRSKVKKIQSIEINTFLFFQENISDGDVTLPSSRYNNYLASWEFNRKIVGVFFPDDVSALFGAKILKSQLHFSIFDSPSHDETPAFISIYGCKNASEIATSEQYKLTSTWTILTAFKSEWSVPNWGGVSGYQPESTTPNLNSLIQEMIDFRVNKLALIFIQNSASNGIRRFDKMKQIKLLIDYQTE